MQLHVELDRESDGRFIAEVPGLPGVIVYGENAGEAIENAKVLARQVIADRVESGELDAPGEIVFVELPGILS